MSESALVLMEDSHTDSVDKCCNHRHAGLNTLSLSPGLTFRRFTPPPKQLRRAGTASELQYFIHAVIKERLSKSHPKALGSCYDNYTLAVYLKTIPLVRSGPFSHLLSV